MPGNVRAARERVSQGVLVSDLYKQQQQKPPSSSMGRTYAMVRSGESNAVEGAEVRYIREQGMWAFSNTVETMLNNLPNT